MHVSPNVDRNNPGKTGGSGVRSSRKVNTGGRDNYSKAVRDRVNNHDINPLPPVLNEERRNSCEFDLEKYLLTYEWKKFTLEFSPDHLDLIQSIQKAMLKKGSGLKAYAFPRGSGKSTIAEGATRWGVLYGHIQFPLLVAATGEHRTEMLHSILTELESNSLLYEDFPEVVFPIRMLEHNYLLGKFQHIGGVYTNITITRTRIVLPYVEDAKHGRVIQCASITGRMRGIKYNSPSGEELRPDFVLIDDAQTDKSAKSKVSTDIRERSILGTIMGLSGPDQEITALMPCTVIRQNDLAERFLDRQARPEWRGVRIKLLTSMPTNMELWKAYYEIRKESFRNDNDGVEANQFYIENRQAMDDGAACSWPQRYVKAREISAIQHAMNLYFRDPIAFASEYQNTPLIESNSDTDESLILDRAGLLERWSGVPFGSVPRSTLHITSGIDIQGKLLFYCIVAWKENFGGVICDYGVYPNQPLEGLDIYNPTLPMGSDTPHLTFEPRVFAGLSWLANNNMQRGFKLLDETEAKKFTMFPEYALIDANYALSANAVYSFCRERASENKYLPANGRGITAAMVPMDKWRMVTGEKRIKGMDLRILPATLGANRGRHASFDGNQWKNVIVNRLLVPKGNESALLFYGDELDKYKHETMIAHFLAEQPNRRTHMGRTVNEWALKEPKLDNHLFDCLILAACAAGLRGLTYHTEATENMESKVEVRKLPEYVEPPPRKSRVLR